jgi:hypothetical protein
MFNVREDILDHAPKGGRLFLPEALLKSDCFGTRDHSGRLNDSFLLDDGCLDVLLDDGCADLGLNDWLLSHFLDDGCPVFFCDDLLMLLVNNRLVDLVDYLAVLLMDNRLMNLSDLLLVDHWLNMLVDHRLVMLVDNFLVMLNDHRFVVLVNHLSVMLLIDRRVDMSLNSCRLLVSDNFGLLLRLLYSDWLVMPDHLRLLKGSLNDRLLKSRRENVHTSFLLPQSLEAESLLLILGQVFLQEILLLKVLVRHCVLMGFLKMVGLRSVIFWFLLLSKGP